MKKRNFIILAATTLLMPLCLSSCSEKEPYQVRNGRKTYNLYFKKFLKDPSSFTVYSEKYELVDETTVKWTIDYGARNGMGGVNRKTVTFETWGGNIDIEGEFYTHDQLK